ncbi:hypothetical protein ACW7GZ_14695 [Luteimonas sp. A537]
MSPIEEDEEPRAPDFLFLNESDREGATSALKAAGFNYKKKRLDSSPQNWETIVEALEIPSLIAVLGKATTFTFRNITNPDYADVSDRLITKLSSLKHVIFVHESILTGASARADDFSEDGYFGPSPYFVPPESIIVDQVLGIFKKHRINMVAYTTNAELSVLASHFIEQNQRNLIFRVYVPSDGIFANEAKKVLELFHIYLTRVSDLRITHEQNTTGNGIVHEFFADHSVSAEQINSEFESFTEVVSDSVQDPSRAIMRMEQSGVPTRDTAALVEKFAKEARRLRTDIRHDLETKMLSIRHRLEDALSEMGLALENSEILEIAAAAIPPTPTIVSAVGASGSVGSQPPNILVNHGVIVSGTVHGIVSKELTGQANLGASAAELMTLITKYGEAQQQELKNSLLELVDEGTSQTNKIAAHSKLKTFALWIGKEIGSSAIDLLKEVVKSHIPGL